MFICITLFNRTKKIGSEVCKAMASRSGSLRDRQSVLNKVKHDIGSIETCFEEATEFQKSLSEARLTSKEHFRSYCSQIAALEKELIGLASEYKELEKQQEDVLAMKERLLQCKESLAGISYEQNQLEKDPAAKETDRWSLRRQINWYQDILGVTLNRIQGGDGVVFGLTFSHLSPHVESSATLRFSLQDKKYKFLGSDPALAEDILKRSEERLNSCQDFQAFLCYIRRQFAEAIEVG